MKRVIYAAVALAASGGLARASVLVSDGFNYATGADALVGKSGGNWDATRAWARGGSTQGSINGANIVAGLTFGSYAVSGNAAEIVTNHNGDGPYASVVASRQLPATLSVPAGSTLYTSFLFRALEAPSFSRETQLRLGSGQFDGGNKLTSRPITAFGDDGPDNAAVGPANEVGASSAAVVQGDTTYLVVSKFTRINSPDFSGGNAGTLWLLNAAEYDAIAPGGITEAELDANNVARVTKDEPSDFTVTLTGNDYLRLSAQTAFGINNRSVFDEVKLFTSLNDLAPVPEPSTACLAAAGIALVGRRRRRPV